MCKSKALEPCLCVLKRLAGLSINGHSLDSNANQNRSTAIVVVASNTSLVVFTGDAQHACCWLGLTGIRTLDPNPDPDPDLTGI